MLRVDIGVTPFDIEAPTLWKFLLDATNKVTEIGKIVEQEVAAIKAYYTREREKLPTKEFVESKAKALLTESELRIAAFMKKVIQGDLFSTIRTLVDVQLPALKQRLEKLERVRNPNAGPSQTGADSSNPMDVDQTSQFFAGLGIQGDGRLRTAPGQAPTSTPSDKKRFELLDQQVSMLTAVKLVDQARMADLVSRTEERAV